MRASGGAKETPRGMFGKPLERIAGRPGLMTGLIIRES
jgi:hypothetical protein